MRNNNPEWFQRDEPARITPEGFEFKQEISVKELGKIERNGKSCLAKQLANAEGFNSASDAMRGAISYGGAKELEDGSREQLVGCGACGAICAIVKSPRTQHATPGTETNPNTIVSIAEAPQPNPWDELGTFDDCKAGNVTVPPEANSLTKPVGLDYEQRAIFKIMRGHFD